MRFSDHRQHIDQGHDVDEPEDARDLQLDWQGRAGCDERQRDEEEGDECGGAPDERGIFGCCHAGTDPAAVCPPEQSEECEVETPGPRRPPGREQGILRRHRLQPGGVHRSQGRAQASGGKRPEACHAAQRGGCHRTRSHPAIQNGQRDAEQHREPHRRRGVDDGGDGHERHRQPGSAPQDCCRGEQAEAERQHPRMKVRLEGIRARPRDAVTQGKRGAKRGHDPRTAVDAGADEYEAGPGRCQREQVTGEEEHLDREAARAEERAEDLVEHHVAPLRVQQRAVVRKCAGIGRMEDDGNVEGLIGGAVAVSRAIRGGHQRERDSAGQRQPHRAAVSRCVGLTCVHWRGLHFYDTPRH